MAQSVVEAGKARALALATPLRLIEIAVAGVVFAVGVVWGGAQGGALALAAVGIYPLAKYRDVRLVARYLVGVVIAVLVVGFVSIATDPCFPLCVPARTERGWIGDAAMLGSTIGWIAACLAHPRFAERSSKPEAAARTNILLLVLIAVAAVGVAAVEVVTCNC